MSILKFYRSGNPSDKLEPIKAMFDCIKSLKQANPHLTERILKLFESNFGLTGGNNTEEATSHHFQREMSAKSEEYFHMNTTVKKGATILSSEIKPIKTIFVTPQSQPLIIELLGYFAHAKHVIDERLFDILCTLLRMMLLNLSGKSSFDFTRGYPDPEMARHTFEVCFFHRIEQVLANKYLPVRYHALISEIMSIENAGFFNKVVSVIEGQIVIKEETQEYAQWTSLVKLCKMFSPRQTEEIINKLKTKYQSSSIREGLQRDVNRKILIRIIRMVLMNQNGIVLQQLRQQNNLQDLQAVCLSQINKFLRPLSRSTNSNQNSQTKYSLRNIEPYLSLLLSLLIIHDMNPPQSSQTNNNSPQSSNDHLLAEFLLYFLKGALDRAQPLLKAEDAQLVIKLIVRAIREHQMHQKDKEELLEVLEVLTLFTGTFQGQNQGLLDLLINSNGNQRYQLADQSTRISATSHVAGVNPGGMHSYSIASQSSPSLLQLNNVLSINNLTEVFENGILSIVQLESMHDSSYQEASASLKLLNSLIRFMQSLRKTDDSVPNCITFKLRMIEILVRNYGVNESIKQAVQAITHKLVKSFDHILTRLGEIEVILNFMRALFKLVLSDIQREDLSLFLLQETSKLFKKQSNIYLMPDIFLIMATQEHHGKPDQHVFSVIVSIANMHWHDQHFEGVTSKGFSILLKALCLSLKSTHQSSKSAAHHEPKSYQQFVQMWIVIFSFLTLNKKQQDPFNAFLPQLAELAELTPYLVYLNEFSLMLRMGSNKEVLEEFTEQVFKKFACFSLVPASHQNMVTQPKVVDDNQKKELDKKKKAQPKQQVTVVEIEDSDEEEEGLELPFGERLFLAMYAQIQEFRMNSITSQKTTELGSTHNNFIESLLTIFLNDKIDSELFTFRLEKLSQYLFDQYLLDLKVNLEQDSRKQALLTADYTFLIKSSCHLQRRLSIQSRGFLISYTECYPYLMMQQPKVLATYLDILEALNTEMGNVYDSLSHSIKLQSTGEQVYLPTRSDQKLSIMQDLTNLFQDSFLYGSIISQSTLNLNFEGYKLQMLDSTIATHKRTWHTPDNPHCPHFGIALFEHLRSTLDLSRLTELLSQHQSASLPLNFHTLGKLAVSKPAQFVRLLNEGEIKRQVFGNSQDSATSGGVEGSGMQFMQAFNVAKKQQSAQIERILNTKPFSNVQALGVCHLSLSSISKQNEVELQTRLKDLEKNQYSMTSNENQHFLAQKDLYLQLEKKLHKYAKNLDIYHLVKHMLKYHSKEATMKILKKFSENHKQHKKQANYSQIVFESSNNNGLMKRQMTNASSMMLQHNKIDSNVKPAVENCLFQHIPMSVRETQKLNKTLQKLVHQTNRKQYITKLTSKIDHIMGLMIALFNSLQQSDCLNKLPIKSTMTNKQTSSLAQQILCLISTFPSLTLCKESITCYKQALDVLKVSNHNENFLLSIMPLSIKLAMTKLQHDSTQYETDRIVKSFELVNQLKKAISESNEDGGVIKMLEDIIHIGDASAQEFLTIKCNSNWSQEQSQKQVIKYMTAVMYMIQDAIISESMTKSMRNLEHLNQTLLIIMSKANVLVKASQIRGFTKLALMIIKTGMLLLDINKLRLGCPNKTNQSSRICFDISHLKSSIYDFMMRYLRIDLLNAHTDTLINFKEEVQLITDIISMIETAQFEIVSPLHQQMINRSLAMRKNYLSIPVIDVKENLILMPNTKLSQSKRAKRRFLDLAKHQLNVSLSQSRLSNYLMQSKKKSQYDVSITSMIVTEQDYKLEKMIGAHLLNQQRLTILAWNYNEKMVDYKFPQAIEPYVLQEKVKTFVQRYPKLALSVYQKVGTHMKIYEILKGPLTDDIILRPHLYQHSTESLELYLDHFLPLKLLQDHKNVISLWRCWNFVKMSKYLGFKYNGEYFVNQLALKPFEFVKSKTILLYLPQIFQSLRNDSHNQIQMFLIKKSKEFASVAHNVLWFCKVEQIPDKSKGRKVPLPLRENLPEVTMLLEKNIIKHMTIEQLQFFETETEFFERVTSISGLIHPKQSKDEKKAIIKEKLTEYNKSIPESVYLPTNSNCRVQGIVTTSGAPMQSAARVPIMISFEVEEYPGPDNDPILTQGISQNSTQTHVQQSNEPLTFSIKIQRQNSMSSQMMKKSIKRKNSARKHRASQQIKNNDDSIVQDEREEEELNIGDVDSGVEDYEGENHNVSPKQSPASQIAVLNVKSRLHQYNFVTNKNEEKFNSSFLPMSSNKLSPMRPSKTMRTDDFKYEEEKVALFNPKNATQTLIEDQYVFIRIQNDERPSIPLTGQNSNKSGAKKSSVSELELRKTMYKPITDVYSRGGNIGKPRTQKQIRFQNVNQKKRKQSIFVKAVVNSSHNIQENTDSTQRTGQSLKIVSCIFKVNDDLRQDIIALQIIKLFQKIFKKYDLDLFVAPYKCISNRTGEDKTLGGIIECVPNSHSRDQLGKAFEIDLYQYFLKKFGNEHSGEYKLARLNFIKSLSSYSVVSYILQIKDRHNGNIMIDDWGHVIHIDFGFIFDWSPGKDMRFESADFKLTKEFIDILGGDEKAEAYQLFVTKTVQAYLAIREHYAEFRNLIQLMYYSGFPCFKEQSLLKLEERFRLDLNVLEAGNHMRSLIHNAHDKWTTKFYDHIQYLQNKIVF